MTLIDFLVSGSSILPTPCSCHQIKNPSKALEILTDHPIHQKRAIDFWDDKMMKSLAVFAGGAVVAGGTYLASRLLAPWLAKVIIITALGISVLGLYRFLQAAEISREIEKEENRYSNWDLASKILKYDSTKMLALWKSYAEKFFVEIKESFNKDTYSKLSKNEQFDLLGKFVLHNPYWDNIFDRVYKKGNRPTELALKYDLFTLFASNVFKTGDEVSPPYLTGYKKAGLKIVDSVRSSILESILQKQQSLKSEESPKIYEFAKKKINTYYDEKVKEIENYSVEAFKKIDRKIPEKATALINLLSTQNLNVNIEQVKDTIYIENFSDLSPKADYYGSRLEHYTDQDIIDSGIAKEHWQEFFPKK